MDVRVRIGLNLQNLRRERNISQEELAHRAKIHPTYLSGVERGRRNPTVVVLQRIAISLGADIQDLVATGDNREEGVGLKRGER
ncbi:helix-turn-helix domain-containing protein [Labrys miyagiensis]